MKPLKLILKGKLLPLLIFTSMTFVGHAQFSIKYPNSAEGITVCLDTTILTVKVEVGAVSTNNDTVFVNFPRGVSYIPGSVTKTGGTTSLGISDAGGSSEAPKFAITPASLVSGQNIEFTIKRSANCAARLNAIDGGIFKDNITIKGSAGTTVENDPTINAYNVNFPSISFTQPPTINNTIIGGTYTRNFSITNGAAGCAKEVYFYIVYPNAGLQLQSLSLNNSPIIPAYVKDDTLFYAISGKMLSADGLFCNGEILVFTETFKVKQCNSAPTSYSAGWGCSSTFPQWCQMSGGQGTISYAEGVPAYTLISRENIDFVDKCTPFDYTLTLTNGGTGDVTAATMYDIDILQGQNGQGLSLSAMDTSLFTLSNVRIGSASVPFKISNGIMSINLKDLLRSDPDGSGGLADMDGDGYFDDLPGGQSVKITVTLKFKCSVACNTNKSLWGLSATLSYHTICDKTVITADRLNSQIPSLDQYEISEEQFLGTAYLPANINKDVPFRIILKAGYLMNQSYYNGLNTRYRWKVVVPTGIHVSGSGNPTYGSTPVTYTQVGDTIIYTSSGSLFDSFSIDLFNDCLTVAGTKSFEYTLEKIQDITSLCKCQGNLICATVSTLALCPEACSAGPKTYIPIIKRTDGSLGWTDSSLTTRQNASAISTFDLSKALYLDTIQIEGSARQNYSASNLHLELKLDKTTLEPIGLNKLTPLSATVNIYRAGILINSGIMNAHLQSNSTATMQQIDWDITSILPPGGLLTGDSIYTISKYLVAINNGLPQNDIQSGNRWSFYNVNDSGERDECNFVIPEMYLVGTSMVNEINSFKSTGCNLVELGDHSYHLARRFNTSGVLYQNEYRPVMYVESVELDVPVGYEFISAVFSSNQYPGTIAMTPNSINGHIYTFINPGTWKNLPLTVENDYGGNVTVTVRPNCATQTVENINVKTHIRDFYYAYVGKTIPSEMSVILEGSQGRTDPIKYSILSRPELVLSDQTGLIQAAAPSESWVLRLSSLGISAVPYTWIGIPNKANIQVNEVKDIDSNTSLAPIPYPGGSWYQLNASGLSSGSSKDYRISFNYTTSLKDSLSVLAGWNCGDFPSNPNAYPCGVDSIWLKFAPVISEIEIVPLSVPKGTIDLCVPASFMYAVNNSQAGNTVNNTFSIKVPAGLFPISGSFEAEYPQGSNNWSALSPLVSGNVYTYDLTQHPAYPSTTGLPGTLHASTINDRQIGVRFQTSTNCDFVANTNFLLKTTADLTSGKLAIGSLVSLQGPVIAITGITEPYTTINSLSYNGLNACSNTATIDVKTLIAGGETGSTGTLKIELPAGLELVPNSISCSSIYCPTFISTTLQPDNSSLLVFSIPSKVSAGNIMQFSIGVKENSLAVCGINTIDLRTEEMVNGTSCTTSPGGVCNSLGVVTGTGQTTVTIERPEFSFVALTGNVTATPGISETYNVDFTVKNTGSANLIPSNPFIIDFYCADVTGNPTGSLLSTYTSAVSLPIDGSFTSNFTFNANGCNPAGDLVAVISSLSNCICSRATQRFHANLIPMAIADNITTTEDTPVSFNIIANDIDLDGMIDPGTIDLDALTPGQQTSLTIVGMGTFSVNKSTGEVTFNPFPNFNGLVTPITYQVCDNGIIPMCSQAIIKVTVTAVNDTPMANHDDFATLEDTPINSSVADNDILSGDGGNSWSLIGSFGGAMHGTVTMNNSGSFTYTPNSNYFGLDTFSYKLCDSNGDCSQTTATLTVNPVNDPPVAVDDNFVTKENQPLDGNILTNDYDIDGDPIILNLTPDQQPSHGMVSLTANGDFIYQPTIDFMGTDFFTYQICDTGSPSLCSTATVTIMVTKDEGCEVFIPDSFSPDGDGIHDTYKIRCLYNYENPIIEIYNRWGNLVYKKDHYGNVDYWGSEADAWWNGRSDHKIGNELLPVGTYYYVLKLNNIKILTGFLFLNR